MELKEYLVSSLTQIPVKELKDLRQMDVRAVLYQAPIHATIEGIKSYDGRPLYVTKINKAGRWMFNKPMPYQQVDHVWTIEGLEVTVEQLISIVKGYNQRYKLDESFDINSVPEKNRHGNCFQVAAELVLQNPEYTLVHGVPTGQGAIEGLQYSHAWVEHDGMVRDDTVGIEWPKDAYYRLGNIEITKKYNYKETLEKLIETENWGPWDKEILKYSY